jgi:hypothetical protein
MGRLDSIEGIFETVMFSTNLFLTTAGRPYLC